MSHGPDMRSVIEGSPRPLPKGLVVWCSVAIFFGVFGAHWTYAQHSHRAMAAFLTNIVYWLGMCQGAFMFAVALTLTKARWGRGLKRIAESFAVMVPVIYTGLITWLLIGGFDIYPWTKEVLPPHKAIWLDEGFFFCRQVFGLGLVILLTFGYLRASWRPDLGMMRDRLGAAAPGWWSWFLVDWQDLETEVALSEKRQRAYGVVLAIVYSLVFSMVAVDLEMSLAPHWFANMFPAWYFMSCFWSGLVGLAIYSLLARDWLGLGHVLTPSTYHDLGKLTFGLCMFWGYTTYAQYLAIWYGNMTEETGFILLRTTLEPWNMLSRVVVCCCFLIPFTLLLSRGMKKIRSGYLAVASLLAIGIFLERFLVVMPSVWTESTLPLGFGEIMMPLGFGGTLVLLVSCVLSQIPTAPITDPYLQPNPMDIHVHPSNHAAAR
jgi:hypothetical protein